MGKGNKGWLWGAAIGTIVGSVTALLFAPKAGKELRKDIAEGARQVGEKTQEVAEKVTEQGAVIVSKVKETAEGLISEIQSRRPGKDVASEEIPEAQMSEFSEENEAETDDDTVVLGVVTPEETAAEETAAEETAADEEVPSAEAQPAASEDKEEESK